MARRSTTAVVESLGGDEAAFVARIEPVAKRYGMTEHMKQRCAERGIGVFEVYAAIDEPNIARPGHEDGEFVFIRDDVQVVVVGDTIKTVVDRFADGRSKAREPQTPSQIAARTPRNQAADEAWVLAPHDEPETRIMFVTPEVAGKLVALDTANRPKKPAALEEYGALMRAGKWKGAGVQNRRHTHPQGITIDWNQVVQDGGHRLLEMTETGTGVWMVVGVGFDPANFPDVDTGRNRKYADVLGKERFANAAALGSLAKLIHLALTDDRALRTNRGQKVSNADVLARVVEDRDGFTEALAAGYRLKSGARCTVTGAAAAYYLIRRINPKDKVDEFFDRVANGLGITSDSDPDRVANGLGITSDSDPVKKFRDQMLNRKGKRSYGPEHLALLLKAWRLWASGEEAKHLSWRRDEKMPAVYRIEKEG